MCYVVLHYLLLKERFIAHAFDFTCLIVDICSSLQIISYSPKSRINGFKQLVIQTHLLQKYRTVGALTAFIEMQKQLTPTN